MENSFENNNQQLDETAVSPVIIRRKINGGYGWASSIILWQQLFATIAILVFSVVFSSVVTKQVAAENPGLSTGEIIAKVQEAALSSDYTIVSNAACMVIANILAVAVVMLASRRVKLSRQFKKPSCSVGTVGLAMLAIIGCQAASMFIQAIATALTGYTGMSEEMAGALSFSENTAVNVVLVLYAVILGPVLEEIMFRGLALNMFAPANRTFAFIVSSLLFGFMHMNFNQIFNGFLLGLVLGYIALKSRSIIPAIICHIFANGNAFLLSYIFEIRMGEQLGEETAAMYMMAAFAVELVIGIPALIALLKRQGKVKADDIITPEYVFEIDEAESKKLGWGLLVKNPVFWVSSAFCVIIAITMLSPIAV